MKVHALSLGLALNTAVTSALKIPFLQAKRSLLQHRSGGTSVSVSRPGAVLANNDVLTAASGGGTNNANVLDMNDVHDLVYIANITVGGNSYPVQLDTGSSDLWVKGPSTPLPNSNQTSQTYNLTYGIGWAYGHVSYASAEFAGISVPQQAFLDTSSAQNPALTYGAMGIAGLGMTALSTIDALVNMTNSSTGRSLLYNLFMDNPQDPNFIAFSLERSSDQNDTADGTFSVGEYDPKYQSIANTTAVPTFPVTSPKRWSVLVDSIVVGSKQVPVTTSVASAPANKAVALLDSGTSLSYAPTDVCQAIYGGVKGAKFDSSSGQWIVPCDAEIDMALQINNQLYPLHPLDVTPISLTDSSTCAGSFLPQAVSVGQGEFDLLIGDNFLRSVYTIYNFGDFDSSGQMGNPYIRLLSLVDPTQASVDFHNMRGGAPNPNITYNASNSTDGSTTVSLSDDVAQVLDKIGKFFPAMLAVMGFNALILLVLVIVGVVILCNKRRPKVSRKTRGRMSPVPLNRTSRFGAEPAHAYEPVSMALTEDTFIPPMPAFRGDTVRSKNSRKSSYSTISPSSPTSAISSFAPPPDDSPFTPPGVPMPTFSSEVRSGGRPMSSFVPSATTRQSFMPPNRPQSSYVPSANSLHNPQFARPPASFTNELNSEDRPRPSFASSMIAHQESPFETPVASLSEEQPVNNGYPPPIPIEVSPDNSLFVPPFRSNVQPGDRPRSYVPTVVSPEDELFAPPSAAFRGVDRPRSMA